MTSKAPFPRDISPMLQLLRNFLGGRKVTIPVRFSKEMAPRSGPEANLPPGPSHRPSANYYYTRDGRREVTFPRSLVDNTKMKVLPSGKGEAAAAEGIRAGKGRTPGAVHKYSQ